MIGMFESEANIGFHAYSQLFERVNLRVLVCSQLVLMKLEEGLLA